MKTEELCNLILKEENPIVFSFTNKAVQNVSKVCYTFDSYFCDWNDSSRNIKDKTICQRV